MPTTPISQEERDMLDKLLLLGVMPFQAGLHEPMLWYISTDDDGLRRAAGELNQQEIGTLGSRGIAGVYSVVLRVLEQREKELKKTT